MAKVTNRARRIYSPLDVSVAVVCTSPLSPFTQTTDGVSYFPDRTLTGYECVAYPQVNASAKDNSWDNKQSNGSLTNMHWYVATGTEWKDISSISEWSGKYEIDTSTYRTRGSLTIKRNLPSNGTQQLRFEADIYDYRTEQLIHIIAEPVTLYTVDKGADTYGMGILTDTDISYNPFLDQLALYDYKVANGLTTESTSARSACFDGNQYERHIPIEVYKTKNKITSGFSVELYRGTSTKLAASTASAPNEVISISTSEIVLDLRLVEKESYTIKAKIDGTLIAQFQFTASRFYPPVSQPKFVNQADIEWGKIFRGNTAIVEYNGNVISFPNRLLEMQWSTLATNGATKTTKEWQEGNSCRYRLDDTGLGISENDYLEEYVEYNHRPANQYLIDEDDYLTDENGSPLID